MQSTMDDNMIICDSFWQQTMCLGNVYTGTFMITVIERKTQFNALYYAKKGPAS